MTITRPNSGRTLLVIGALLALLVVPSANATAATLVELVNSALATHENIERAESQLRRARADLRLTRSALMPRLTLNAGYTMYGDEQKIELSPGEEFVIRPRNDWSWSADLRQTLFYGLRDWRARDVALLYRDIAKLNREVVAYDLVLDVSARFYEAVMAEQRLEVSRTALEQIKSQLRTAERRFEVGETTIADVARWRAEVAAEIQRLVLTEGEAVRSRRALARLASVPDVGKLQAPGRIPVPDGEMDQLVEDALDTRLEMVTLRHQLEAAGMMIKIEKGAWLPELEANAQYFQQLSAFPSQDWMSFALTLKVPIYDGGLTAARVAKAKEDLREIQLLEQEIRRGISDQVDAGNIRYLAAKAAHEAAKERQEAAAEAYRQVDRAYRVGEASATDLLVTTTQRIDAETAAIIARANMEFGAIELRRAVGSKPLPDLNLDFNSSKDN
ncbi:MAG: TolC family protein [bacterium]|nr:TolC family protein [bacterium]